MTRKNHAPCQIYRLPVIIKAAGVAAGRYRVVHNRSCTAQRVTMTKTEAQAAFNNPWCTWKVLGKSASHRNQILADTTRNAVFWVNVMLHAASPPENYRGSARPPA